MNEPFRIIRNSSLSAVTFFVTILGLSYGYASLNSGLTLSDRTSSGSLLSAGVWNKLVESVVELDSRTATLSSSGGNLGVGTINPGRTVHVYKSTNVDMTLDQDAPSGVSWLYFGNDTNDNNAKAAIGLG